MRCLDLFCGAAGGWTLGLHRAGWTTVAACEVDPWRRSVFSRNWPEVVMFDDVRTLAVDALAGLGPIDAIVGSPPCQDASTANAKGRGVDGERTGLFFDAVRLVREVRPRWVCFENVPGLRARGYDRVHDALEAAGYAVRPLVVGAWHAGAPHKRNRVWIIGNLPHANSQGEHELAGDGEVAGQLVRARAHAAPVLGSALVGREPDGVGTGVVADAGRQPGQQVARGASGNEGTHEGRPSLQDNRLAGVGESERRCGAGASESEGTARHPDQARLAVGEGEPGDARQEQPPAFGASLRAWGHWNGGAPDLGRVDDGLSRALAALRVRGDGRRPDERHGRPSRKLKTTGVGRNVLAAYGDAVVPAITEMIGRAIFQAEMRAA